jgi:HK97 family phage portal protein
MSILSRIAAVFPFTASEVTVDGSTGWSGDVDAPFFTAAGYPVTAQSVMKLSLVMTCCNKIAKSVAALPLKIYERTSDGKKQEAGDHPLSDILHDQPNDDQTAFEFRSAMTWDLAFYRVAYAEIIPGPRGAVDQLLHLPGGTVRAQRIRGQLWFRVRGQNGAPDRMLHRDEVFRLALPPYGDDGITPKPIYELGREALSKALALQDYASSYFRNNGGTGPWISMEKGWFATDQEADNFLGWLKSKMTPARRHEPKPLPFGAKVTPGGVKNNEAQFLETWQATAREVIALFDIPPHKVGDLEKATFSNIEQQGLEFIQDTLLSYLTAWEQAIKRDLIIAKRRYFAEHTLAALLRGDLQARYLAYAIGRQWGWLSVNDILKRENMNGIGPKGDVYLSPLNMGEAGKTPAPDANVSEAFAALIAALETADPDALAASLKTLRDEQGQADE